MDRAPAGRDTNLAHGKPQLGKRRERRQTTEAKSEASMAAASAEIAAKRERPAGVSRLSPMKRSRPDGHVSRARQLSPRAQLRAPVPKPLPVVGERVLAKWLASTRGNFGTRQRRINPPFPSYEVMELHRWCRTHRWY